MNNIVLVTHCVDTEGPIGGDVRRREDGSQEFMGTWEEIMESLGELTSDRFRQLHADSFGNPYLYNWFLMDFTGFKTNPKNRVTKYNDTYDHIISLPTQFDHLYWHYHHPPTNGVGDQWSGDWDSSDEYNNILCHRLIDRHDFPEVFRAGGTIEDNKCSHWLEKNIMVDYSNRVSKKSYPTDNIFDFNWFGTPSHQGFYHPSFEDFTKPGSMRRYIVKCNDLKSRLCEVNQYDVDECFAMARYYERPILLSYFSHDHRDMREETDCVYKMLTKASLKYNINWEYCGALAAVQRLDNLDIKKVFMDVEIIRDMMVIKTDSPIYQDEPFVAVKYDREYARLYPIRVDDWWWCNIRYALDIGVAVTSLSGNKTVWSKNVSYYTG